MLLEQMALTVARLQSQVWKLGCWNQFINLIVKEWKSRLFIRLPIFTRLHYLLVV